MVINIKTIGNDSSMPGFEGYAVNAVAESNGRWAALLTKDAQKSVVLTGNARGVDRKIAVPNGTDNIQLDSEHTLHIRTRTRTGGTKMSVHRTDGTLWQEFETNEQAVPFIAAGAVNWRTSNGLIQLGYPNRRIASEHTKPDANNLINQRIFLLGLPSGGFYTVGDLTETVSVFDSQGNSISESHLDLDRAYSQLGLSVSRSDPTTGRTRIMWATSSSNGQLIVCLSETPGSKPAYLAVPDPLTGHFSHFIVAHRPMLKSEAARVDPNELFLPTMGAMGDQLILVDKGRGLIAVY